MSDSGDGDGCVSSDGGGFGNDSDNYFIGFRGYHGLSFSSIVLKQRSYFLKRVDLPHTKSLATKYYDNINL